MEFEGIDLPLRQNEATEIQGWIRSGEGVAKETPFYDLGKMMDTFGRGGGADLL